VELDSPLAKRLQAMAARFPNLRVQHSDHTENRPAHARGGAARARLWQPAYYITSPILHHLFEFADLIDEIHM